MVARDTFLVQNVGWLFAGTLAATGVNHQAAADINLEFRPVSAVVSTGQQVQMQLFAVSDAQTDQLLSAIQLVFAWQPMHLTLTGTSAVGAPPLAFSGFPASGHFGLNESPIPQDGDGFYLALSFSPIAATPAGTLITTLNFNALAPTVGTSIDILSSGGVGGQTIVASGSVPGLDVTGTFTSGVVTIVPGPGGVAMICGGLAIFTRSRRRR